MKLVKYDDNWADEMDLNGFKIMNDQDYEVWWEDIKESFKANPNQIWYCGSNEEVEFEGLEDFTRHITVDNIYTEQAIFLQDAFTLCNGEYGDFPYIEE